MNKGNYKDGRTLKKYYCKEKGCNNKICLRTALYGQGRCHSCAQKEKLRNLGNWLNISGKEAGNYKDGRSLKKYYCEDCREEICQWSGIYGNHRCAKCNYKFLSGKKHHWYIHGQGNFPYPIEFNDELKETIRKRDNYICQNCSMTEEEHIIVCGTVLNVHHIDYNKKNCSEDNLITLCGQCNLRANHNRDYWKKYYRIKLCSLKN